MQVRCIKAFGTMKPGETAEVPDGAAVDPEHFEAVQSPAPDAPKPAAPAALVTAPAKGL